MQSVPQSGQDGPYDAPIRIAENTVKADWIDFNGHMNAKHYGIEFQVHAEKFLEDVVGFGVSFSKNEGAGPFVLQVHLHYLGELKEGERFSIDMMLLDHDTKRMHMLFQMRAEDGRLCATAEYLNMNVDLTARKGREFPDWLKARLESMQSAHDHLERPKQVAAPLGLRR